MLAYALNRCSPREVEVEVQESAVLMWNNKGDSFT